MSDDTDSERWDQCPACGYEQKLDPDGMLRVHGRPSEEQRIGVELCPGGRTPPRRYGSGSAR
ncbi:hypothetical protein SAMN06265360_1068 [Haloechinothrix alba]|uniref:Uncharacterized protein n=1 Tax=Haloechinothrix alba TaxID=664784 RepID=A0A238WBJ1_9PSEU|nr:hypothetical protein [Haloechinothrix alba]SNR43946.1 hypothetical protein SAMN06265360_1068 [Haloechinothrix alba]